MKSFFKFFAERHLLANLITIIVLLLGISTLFVINRSSLPTVDLGGMLITTYYPGASSEDVELNVTNKLENELKTVTDLKSTTSTSMENVSIIYVELEPDVKDMEKVKRNVREAIARVTDFPDEIDESPSIIEIKSSEFPVVEIGISGDLPYKELREIARLFEKKLKNISGIGKVTRYGYYAREIQIEVSPEKLQQYQIPLWEIINAVKVRNIRATGGSLESYTSEKNVVTLSQFTDPLHVGNVIVRSSFDGPLVKVKDLAIINDDFEEERIISRMNGKQVVSFELTKGENSDTIRTVDAIKKLIKKEKQNLPEGIEFIFNNDLSKLVKATFKIVITNAVIGLFFVLIILSLFFNIRSAFWVAMGIPFTIFGSIALLPFFDLHLDTITLTALVIVIGIIVDDAIIVSENIFRRKELGDSPLDAAVNGTHEVYKPVITTIFTTFLAFAPMFFMKGMLGKFVFVVPLTISLALFLSMFEALTVLPAHILPSLKSKEGKKGNYGSRKWFNPIRIRFEKMMYKILKLRYVWILVAIGIFFGAIAYAMTSMDFILFPSKGAEFFYAYIELPIGSSLNATSDKAKEIENIIANLPKKEVESFGVRVGSYVDMVDTEMENFATLTVNLTPFGTRKRTADEIVEEVRGISDELTGFKKITYIVDSGGPPTGKPVELRIVGSDDKMRRKLADDVFDYINTIEGVKDPDRDDKLGKEQIVLNINYDRLARLGLTVADISSNIRIAYDGQVVTSVRYGEEDVSFRVIIEEKARKNLDYLRKMLIPNTMGRMIPLYEVSSLDIGPGTSSIHHYEGERSVTITADLFQKKTTPVKVMNTIQEKFDPDKDYPGTRFVIGGEAEESSKAMIELLITFFIAAIGIYFLLVLLFNSLTQPFMVILAIPLGLSGVVFAFALHGEPFSFLAMTGIIGMAGVVVNDSLVLVNHLNHMKIKAKDKSKEYLVMIAKGTADRLRPIILTTLTTVGGLIPLVYGLGGESLYMGPMAMAMAYGLLFATPLTLIIMPSVYMVGHDIKKIFKKKI